MAAACLFVMLLASALEMMHLHTSDASPANSAPCMLCVSAHSSAPAMPVIALPVLLVVEDLALAIRRPAVFEAFLPLLFTRPPPPANR